MTTTYTAVTANEADVAAFLAYHLDTINIWSLPAKLWAARQDGMLVAVLMLKTRPYLSLDLVVANPATRPFMRIMKLYLLAETWLRANNVPMVSVSILNTNAHFQSLARRLGYQKIGEESDANGNVVETIYGKPLTAPASLALHAEVQ